MFKENIDSIILSVNSVGDHVWAILLVLFGCAVVLHGQKDVGELVAGGGLALFRGQQK